MVREARRNCNIRGFIHELVQSELCRNKLVELSSRFGDVQNLIILIQRCHELRQLTRSQTDLPQRGNGN